MKLNLNKEMNRGAARDLAKLPAGPARLARRLKLLQDDIAGLPLSADPPPAVVKARKAYDAAAAWAESSIDNLAAAKTVETDAAAADVKKTATAMRKGSASPKLTAAAAADAIQAALVGLQAAEQLLDEAHEQVVDAAYDEWSTWRRSLIDEAAESHAAAFVAAQAAAAAIVEARAVYGSVSSLDFEMCARFAAVKTQVDAERHTGLPWYASTHTGRTPLKYVSIHGVAHNLDLAVVVDAVQQAVASAGAFAPADWTTPEDPNHDAMLATPLDLGAAWVRSAVGRETGTTCPICRKPGADVVVEDEQGSGLVLIHTTCRDRKPDPKEVKRAERLAKMQAGGFPTPPHQSGGMYGTGDYTPTPKDKDFSG